ncbi:hypothetical protein C8R47DRAFT_392055 [Mycena vitilis]|nr:hypothetical protein C8R47DRAFT_392055 [Mycena vitilis]
MFTAGLFSGDKEPYTADAAGFTPAALASAMQVTEDNPFVGLEGRASLLARLRSSLARTHAPVSSSPIYTSQNLVRGAYHTHEIAAHPVPGRRDQTLPPVWERNAETDAAFDACAGLLLDVVAADVKGWWVQGVGALFGTHNGELQEDHDGACTARNSGGSWS